MPDEQLLARITTDPKVMTGKPVITGTRLTVEYILKLLAHGATEAEILAEYKGLTSDDIAACLDARHQALLSSLRALVDDIEYEQARLLLAQLQEAMMKESR